MSKSRSTTSKTSLRQQAVNFVFSRRLFTEPAAFFATTILKPVIATVSDLLLGDIPELISRPNLGSERANSNPDHVGIVRLGPIFWRSHLVVIDPPNNPDRAQLVKTIMDIDTPGARLPYNKFKIVTGANFFLAMDGKPGMDARKKNVSVFNPKKFLDTSVHATVVFLDQQFKKSTCSVSRDNGITWIRKIDYSDLIGNIKKLCREIIATELLGSNQLSEEMHFLFDEIEKHVIFCTALLIPDTVFAWLPETRRLHAKFETLLQQYLQACDPKYPTLTALLEKPGKETDKDIKTLFSALLAGNNLFFAIEAALKGLWQIGSWPASADDLEERALNGSLSAHFKKALFDELQQGTFDLNHLMGNKAMPYLNALFEESLRTTDKIMPRILRRTHDIMHVGKTAIPKHSMIALNMSSPSFFNLSVPLNDEKSPEHKKTELHPNPRIRFGLGKRPCPAKSISEIMFKGIITTCLSTLKKDGAYLEKPYSLDTKTHPKMG